MLGPIDLDDWSCDEADRLRAEIRVVPAFAHFRDEPRATAAILGKALTARVQRFNGDADLPESDLRALLSDLTRAWAAPRERR